MRFRAVVFDAGGTLLDPEPSFHELFSTVLAGRGYSLEPDQVREGLAAIPRRFIEAAEANERWTTTRDGSYRFWVSVYDVFLQRAGLPTGDGLQEALYDTFTTPANYALLPDVAETLTRLEALGVVLGLVSNFESWLDELLEYLGVRERFSTRVISGLEGIEKPDPAIFQLALDRMGLQPHEAVYVGDVPAFDVDPPLALGMGAVLIDRHDRYPQHGGERIRDLRELADLLGAA